MSLAQGNNTGREDQNYDRMSDYKLNVMEYSRVHV